MKIFISTVVTLLFALSIFAQSQAEVIVPRTFLRKSPSSTAEVIFDLQRGAKITLEKAESKNGWYYASTADGKVKGWVNGNTIRSTVGAQTVNPIKTVTQTPIETVNQTSPKAAQAQTPTASPTPSPAATSAVDEDAGVIRIETEEVNLSVRVVDAGNRSVNNLSQTDFKIYEDGAIQPITSLTTAEVPTNYGLVIDNSGSMRSQLGKVVEAGKIIVGTNRPQDESTVIRFVSANKIEVLQDFTADKGLINEALNNLFVEGGQTAIIDAVYLAAKKIEQYEKSRNKDDFKRRVLVLVSDGDDRGSSYKEEQLFELLRASDVQIYAVGFVNELRQQAGFNGINRHEKAKAFLTRLATETGGKVYFPDSINELPQIAKDISSELRTQYLISYAPTNEKRDGTFRNIKVIIAEDADKRKRTAITRAGRTSATGEQSSAPNQGQKP